MDKYTIIKEDILELTEEIHTECHKNNINKGYRFEHYLYNQIEDNQSKNTKLIIQDNSTSLTQIKNSFPYIDRDGKNLFQSKVDVFLNDGSRKICNAIFIERDIVYFVELRKDISNIDTTNIYGIYHKLTEMLKIQTNLPFKSKAMIVSLETTSGKAKGSCKLNLNQKRNTNLEIVGGLDFSKRIGLNYSSIMSWVNTNIELEIILNKIFKKYNIK